MKLVVIAKIFKSTSWNFSCAHQIHHMMNIENTNEPPHDKTNNMARAPSKDSDQPGHPPSLIRVFAVRMKKA